MTGEDYRRECFSCYEPWELNRNECRFYFSRMETCGKKGCKYEDQICPVRGDIRIPGGNEKIYRKGGA